jgi:hypothetical protein
LEGVILTGAAFQAKGRISRKDEAGFWNRRRVRSGSLEMTKVVLSAGSGLNPKYSARLSQKAPL